MRNNLKGGTKVLWRYIKSLNKTTVGVPPLVSNGQTIVDDSAKANALNDYFQTIFHDRTFTPLPTYIPAIQTPMPAVCITKEGIVRLLHSLDSRKSHGPDGISSALLKECCDCISDYLLVLFRRSLELGSLPREWKFAYIVPIFKSGDKTLVGNYRPISLLPVCLKLMVHIIYTSIMKHLSQNNFFLWLSMVFDQDFPVLHS